MLNLPSSPATEASNEPATARAYRILERMIVTLELVPGSIVTEGALIERLSLGRTPVREAVQRLAWEGLVEIRPRAGIAIAPLHPSDWTRVIDARWGLELVLARSAARYVTGEAANRFHAAAVGMEAAVMNADVVAYLEADKVMDEALAFAAENPFAARFAAPLQTHSRRFWFRYRTETSLAEAAGQHVLLIQAILQRDEGAADNEADRLMTLLRAHAEEVARR